MGRYEDPCGHAPQFRITNAIAGSLARIERARGFLDAAKLSAEWITGMQQRALVLEAHHTTHIEGTHLTLDQSERLLAGEKPSGVKADDAREVVNYRRAFDLVADYHGGARQGDPQAPCPRRPRHRGRRGITILVLPPRPLVGFEVSFIGRFSGVSRGWSARLSTSVE